MADWRSTATAGKVTPISHFVIEVNIRHVIPAAAGTGNTGDKGDRVVDDVTRIVTKGKDFAGSLNKAKRLLDVELAEILNEEEDSIRGENFPE